MAVPELAAAMVLALGTGLGGNGGLLAIPEHSHISSSVLVPLEAMGTNKGAAFHCLPLTQIAAQPQRFPESRMSFSQTSPK